MLSKHILGQKLCIETGSEPLKSRFNNILGGKLLVSFEELETFSQAEWAAVESVLKRQITSERIVLQAKGQDSFETKNINNYILLSNHDVYDSDRRMFVLDVQTHYKGNREYWSNLYKNCFNDEVGSALYSYFYEIDTTNFHPQDYPITNNKLNSISKRLDCAYQYLKDVYILCNKDIKMKLSDLYEDYKDWCIKNQKKPSLKNDFISKLGEIQLYHKKSNGYLRYDVKVDVLKSIANKQHWINELDEFIDKSDEAPTVDEYENIIKENEKLKSDNQMIKNMIESNQKMTMMLNEFLKNFNIEKMNQEIEEVRLPNGHCEANTVPKVEKKKSNNKNIQSLIDSIELF